jgi:potassium efflux system protein
MRGSTTPPTFDLFTIVVIAVFALDGLAAAGRAQDKPNPNESPPVAAMNELTIESVQGRIKKLDDNKELDPAVKTKLVDTYTKAMEQLRAAADSTARGDQQLKLIREAPDSLQTIKAELAVPRSDPPELIPKDATLVQVQQLLSQAEMNLADSQKSLQTLQDEPQRRANRRLEVPKLADAAKLQLQEIDKLLDAKPSPDEPVEVTTAARLLLEARKKAITAETTATQIELQMYEATGELLASQRDRAARRVAIADSQVKELRSGVNERRRQEAERQALEARKTSAQAHPVVRAIADANADLAKRRQTLVGKIEATTREFEQIDQQATSLDERFKKITKRYETAGGTTAIGLLLRKQRDELPNVGSHQRRIKQRSVEISETYLDLIDDEEKRNDLATLDERVKATLNGVTTTVPEAEREAFNLFLEAEVRRVLEAQRAVYDSLIADTNSFLDKLVELDGRERQLVAKAGEVAKYCDERILWIRSTTGLSRSHLRQLGTSFAWLVDPVGWREVGSALKAELVEHTALTAIAALVVLVLILLQRPLRRTTSLLGEQAERSNNISYLPTLRVFVTTGLLALLWPGLMGYLGLRLIASENGSDFVAALGHALRETSIVFGTLELFRQVCRRHGLGEAHFDWEPAAVRLVNVASWWFIACGLPLILVVTMTESQSGEIIKNSLGRLAFVCSLAVLAGCMHFVMRLAGGAFEKVYAAAPQSWASRLQRGWYLLSLGAPVALGGLAITGYYYTALQLAWRLLATSWLVMGLWIVYAALIRWTLLSYRDLAMRKNRERRAAAEAAAATAGTTTSVPGPAAKAQAEVVKLSDINKQTRKALQLALTVGLVAGLWLVWIDVLPALGVLRHVNLWMVETTSTVGTATATVLQPVTLANVLLAVVVVAVTFAASRNLPSLLEITLLQRLPLDPGVRYAITTISQYTITAVGLVTAFGTIGIGWSKVQWLIAAISVGLGFGLQEIFANFVSGLILLFERPVRLGDIVTVDNVTGPITRIQMRATTITDWDMRELVVPNKEFITGRVMNWTLSTTVARMAITVGVAYGTDPDLVRSLLMQVATRNPLVLKDPAPHALFNEFGDSTLNFILRVYMASMNVYIELRHTLLAEIASEFQKAGIEIAFPQRDIHIRSGELPTESLDEQSVANGRTSATGEHSGSATERSSR